MDCQPPTAPSRSARWAASRRALWATFVAVHAWLAFVGVVLLPARAFYDVNLYRYWVATGLHGGAWPVLDGPWVYPVGALVPMLVPAAVSISSTTAYALAWCALVTALDAVAIGALRRRGGIGAWWWLAFLTLLGPVSMGRVDAIIAPMVIVALLVAAQQPRPPAAGWSAAPRPPGAAAGAGGVVWPPTVITGVGSGAMGMRPMPMAVRFSV